MQRSYILLRFIVAIASAAGVVEAGGPTAKSVIYEFAKGNRRFMARGISNGIKRKFNSQAMFDKLVEDPLNPLQRKAIVISDARSFAAVDELFNCTEPGELQVVRVAGIVCKKNDEFGGVLGSVEYGLIQKNSPPLVLVMGDSKNEVIEDAVRVALGNTTGAPWENSATVQAVLPAAKDAILQNPKASFQDICVRTAKLNVWNTIEAMITTSRTLHDKIVKGGVQVHGAFLNSDTGKVHFMGEHPARAKLLAVRPAHVRTAKSATVPPEEALAMLYAGNKRYQAGTMTSGDYVGGDRNKKLTQLGQMPHSIVICCSDSRAPPEILFDARPGNIFTVRTAGNTWAAGRTSTLGSTEYALDHLRSKLIVVMGHSNCGAVTATVEAVKAHTNTLEVPGSIGRVIEDLHKEAEAAVRRKPHEATAAQVKLAAELNVFATMEKIISSSPMVAEEIRQNEAQVIGAIYDIESGEVQWLGHHPRLESIVGSPLPLHKWKYTKPYSRPPKKSSHASVAKKEIEMLKQGNRRFRTGRTMEGEPADKPFAIVVAGSELAVPAENIFDTSRGQISVQRSMGNIPGHGKSALFDSLEYNVLRFQPKLLLVLGASSSDVVAQSMDWLEGHAAYGPTHIVHESIGSSALDASWQTAAIEDSTDVGSAGRDMKQRGLTVELNALYTVERLLKKSTVIRDAVREGKLDVQVGILQEDTGKVEFIGPHPMQEALVNDVGFEPTPVVTHPVVKVETEAPVARRESGAFFRSNQGELSGLSKHDVQMGLPVKFGSTSASRDSGSYFKTR